MKNPHQYKKIILTIIAALGLWIAVDLYAPRTTNFRQFDPVTIGKLDADMCYAKALPFLEKYSA